MNKTTHLVFNKVSSKKVENIMRHPKTGVPFKLTIFLPYFPLEIGIKVASPADKDYVEDSLVNTKFL